MDLDVRFQKAIEFVRTSKKLEKSNKEKLHIYALYKQATEGNVATKQPWAINVEASAKWNAWKELDGMPKDEAKEKYVSIIEAIHLPLGIIE